MEPKKIGKHRDHKSEVGNRCKQPPTRYDVGNAFEREGEWQQRETGRHALYAGADPEAATWRELLEQDGADRERDQRGECEQDADGMLDADGETARHHEGNAADAE